MVGIYKNYFSMLESFLFKGLALCSITTLTTPLEVLKMRMQVNKELLTLGRITEQYKSFRNCLKTILKKEGLLGLWKGNSISVARVLPNELISYHTRKTLQQHVSNKLINNVLISILSGFAVTTILYPTDVLRQFLSNQVSAKPSFSGAFRKIVSEYGYKYFYKGYTNVLMTSMIYRGCYNGFYDTHKVSASSLEERIQVAYLSTLLAEYVVHPIEVIRKRRIVMNAKEGLVKYGRSVWKNEGMGGFYKGGSVLPIQSMTWAMVLILFDTAGLRWFSKGEC